MGGADEHADLGLERYRSGDWAQAESLWRNALGEEPAHASSLFMLGTLLCQRERRGEGEELLRRAIAARPAFPEAYCNLGSSLQARGKYEEAIDCFTAAISLRPGFAQALFNRAQARREEGDLDRAVEDYRAALALAPGYFEAHVNLGIALGRRGELGEAERSFRRALELRAGAPQVLNNLGVVVQGQGRTEEAADHFRRALARAPEFAEASHNLGQALRALGRPEEAAAAFATALVHRPGYADACYHLGNAFKDLGRAAEAAAQYEATLRLDPDHPEARWNLALVRLLSGDYEAGWAAYDEGIGSGYRPALPPGPPRWRGGPLEGKRLAVRAEQGFGDTIQFVRYLPAVKAAGATVLLECQRGLGRLLARCEAVDGVRERPPGLGEEPCDAQVSLLSLPYLLGTRLGTIPADVPYVRVDSALLGGWEAALGTKTGRSIGFVWAGNPGHADDARRSVDPAFFRRLSEVPGIRLFSLQKGAKEVEGADAGAFATDLAPRLADFADTAAAICHLDLVLSVDTAVAHLAGALGRPVWLLLPFVPDWRWLLGRDDSPWYPTMRLFRQPRAGDWESVRARVEAELRSLGGAGTGDRPSRESR